MERGQISRMEFWFRGDYVEWNFNFVDILLQAKLDGANSNIRSPQTQPGVHHLRRFLTTWSAKSFPQVGVDIFLSFPHVDKWGPLLQKLFIPIDR